MTFLRLNGVPFPNVPDVEAETFIQAVAQNIFTTDDEPDKTVEKAAEWFKTKWDNRPVGSARDPRVEYALLAQGGGAAVGNETADGTFDALGAGVSGFLTEQFPALVELVVFARIHWRLDDVGRRHRVSVEVVGDEPGLPRVNRSRTEMTIETVVQSAHPHHRDGVIPHIVSLVINPVFLGEGPYMVRMRIDGNEAAELLMRVKHISSITWPDS